MPFLIHILLSFESLCLIPQNLFQCDKATKLTILCVALTKFPIPIVLSKENEQNVRSDLVYRFVWTVFVSHKSIDGSFNIETDRAKKRYFGKFSILPQIIKLYSAHIKPASDELPQSCFVLWYFSPPRLTNKTQTFDGT